LVEIPESHQPEAVDPDLASDKIIRSSCRKAGLLSAGLALPIGPLGLITLMPDLIGVWKIQSQMVSDIASAYGERSRLDREHMLFFLFRHSVSHLVGDVISRSGERYVVQKLSEKTFASVIEKIALRIGNKLTVRATKIVFPLIGAAFLGAYSYCDTLQVGLTAKRFFNSKSAQTPKSSQGNGEQTPDSRLQGIAESGSSSGSNGGLLAGKGTASRLNP
jgi:hypothetical protein